MTISFISSARAEAASVALGTHAAKDIIIGLGFRLGSATPPTLPAGWEKISTISVSQGAVLGWKRATSAGEVSGTWTNSTFVMFGVWRDSLNYLVIGNNNATRNLATTTMNWPTVINRAIATSWFAGFAGGSLNSAGIETPPSGFTNRDSLAGASTGKVTLHDTNGASGADWPSTNQTITSQTTDTFVVEICDSGIASALAMGPVPTGYYGVENLQAF